MPQGKFEMKKIEKISILKFELKILFLIFLKKLAIPPEGNEKKLKINRF
jgi:hypothetical protein